MKTPRKNTHPLHELLLYVMVAAVTFALLLFALNLSAQTTKWSITFPDSVYVISETAQEGHELIWHGQGTATVKLHHDEEMIFRVYLASDTTRYTRHILQATPRKREERTYAPRTIESELVAVEDTLREVR